MEKSQNKKRDNKRVFAPCFLFFVPGRLLASSAFVFALLVQSNASGFNPEHPPPLSLLIPSGCRDIRTYTRTAQACRGVWPPTSPFPSPLFFLSLPSPAFRKSGSPAVDDGKGDPARRDFPSSSSCVSCLAGRVITAGTRPLQIYIKILFSSSKAVCFSWQRCLALYATVRNILGPFLSGKKKLLLINGDLSNNSKGGRERAVRSRSQESLKPPLPGNSCFQSPVPPLGCA